MLVCKDGWSGGYIPLKDVRYELFIHPRTGILLRNRHHNSIAARRRLHREESEKRQSAIRRDLTETTQLHCLDGIWDHVELATLPLPQEIVQSDSGRKRQVQKWVWDAARKSMVSREHGTRPAPNGQPSSEKMYGRSDMYAVSKRQLSSRELADHGLQSSSQ